MTLSLTQRQHTALFLFKHRSEQTFLCKENLGNLNQVRHGNLKIARRYVEHNDTCVVLVWAYGTTQVGS